jgi:hypothetical protein
MESITRDVLRADANLERKYQLHGKTRSIEEYEFPSGLVNLMIYKSDDQQSEIVIRTESEENILDWSKTCNNLYKLLLTIETENHKFNILFYNCVEGFSWDLLEILFHDSYVNGEKVGNVGAKRVSESFDNETKLKKMWASINEDKFQLLKDQIKYIVPCNM